VHPKLAGDVIVIHIAPPRVSAEPVAAAAEGGKAGKGKPAAKAAATKQAPKK
jgi:hypothetical protein